jgi:SAM-dependent methyltransferase
MREELKPYWGFENPRLKEYKDLSLDAKHLYSHYSDRLYGNCGVRHVKEQLKIALEDSIVFDIGCGTGLSITGLEAAPKTRALIGVDLVAKDSYRRIEKTDVIKVRSDMLQFLARIYPDSGNFVFNGIDFLQGDYLNTVVREVERSTKQGGIVFGVGSEPLVSELERNSSFVDLDPQTKQRQLIEKWRKGDEERIPENLELDFFLFRKEEAN